MTYAQKLKDPLWIERARLIRKRDNWTCQGFGCGEKRGELHVHHREYISNREPWEYADCFLVTLCAQCHEAAHTPHPIHKEPSPEKKGKEFSTMLFSKKQMWRMINGWTWINRNCAGKANKLRAWCKDDGGEHPDEIIERIETFIRENGGGFSNV